MADIKPIGIDQTTGQQRPVASDDSVVDNVGNTIEIAIKQVGDYSNGPNQAQILFPWSNPEKINDPASLPGANTFSASWTPNNEFLAVTASSNNLAIYQKVGSNFNLLDTPSSQPGGSPLTLRWSPNGEFLVTTSGTSPFLHIYQRSGTTLTKLSDPTSVPTGNSQNGISWVNNGEMFTIGSGGASPLMTYRRSGTTFELLPEPASAPSSALSRNNALQYSPNGRYLATLGGAPALSIFKREGQVLTRLDTEPDTAPSGNPAGVRWSPDSQFLATINAATTDTINLYQRSGDTFTKLASPASQAVKTSLIRGIDWSPNGRYLAVGTDASPYIWIYERNGTTLTLLTEPSSLPGGERIDVKFSNDGQYLATMGITDNLFIYQTTDALPSSGVVTIIGQPLAN